MDITVRYGRQKILYTEAELSTLSKQQLKQLKADLQHNIEEVGAKKSIYMNTNTEAMNSHEYWQKINGYKLAANALKGAILYINSLLPDAKSEQTAEQKENEHWLWCYFQESKKLLTPECVSDIALMADERAGFHAAIGGE